MTVRMKIVDMMKDKDYRPMLKEEIAIRFDIGKHNMKDFFQVLDSLEKEGIIIKSKNEKYGLVNSEYLVAGILQGNEKGFAFVIPTEKGRGDIFIPINKINGAMHGDRVIANITKGQEVGRREEGEIIRVLERKNTKIVGTFEDNKNFGFVLPDESKINHDIFIPKAKTLQAKTGQKVVVKLTSWPEDEKNPEGSVVEILGYPNEKGTDILSVIRQFDLPEEFPNKVRDMALEIEQEVQNTDLEGRTDLREVKTFTIDGFDAKDLDDAISIRKKENGNFELGVHIADVAHYVKENSAMDKEALERGNSVYLISKVIPMLPPELSNGICSLHPNVDRLCLSVIMEIDKSGKVIEHKILESVINSKARLVYSDVSDYLENEDEEAKEKLKFVLEELELMEELSQILTDKRKRRGSIDFDFPETQIILDENDIPIDIGQADRRIANRIIEEFMLVTNETISEQFFWAEVPFLYRVHEEPSPERIEDFNKLIHNFGYMIKSTQEIHPKELQKLIEKIKGEKEEHIISMLLLRSMKKAIYSQEPEVHFGLAAQYYSHFTAPIRRYPDLTIHRIIKNFLNGKLNLKSQERLESKLPEIAEHTSMTERRAEDAEREVEDLKKAQYMEQFIGEEFDGIISSLTNFGIFVQLDNTIEGLIRFTTMTDDYYHFDEEKYHIIGERTKKIYNLGDQVKIIVSDANAERRTIDFQLLT